MFDKDGTLVCFHTMWSRWCEELVDRLEAETADQLASAVFHLIGYDVGRREVRLGMVAEETNMFIRTRVEELLRRQGYSETRAREVLDRTWKDKQDTLSIKTLGDLEKLFTR